MYKDATKEFSSNPPTNLAPGQGPPEIQPEGPANHTSKGNYTNCVFDHAQPAQEYHREMNYTMRN